MCLTEIKQKLRKKKKEQQLDLIRSDVKDKVHIRRERSK